MFFCNPNSNPKLWNHSTTGYAHCFSWELFASVSVSRIEAKSKRTAGNEFCGSRSKKLADSASQFDGSADILMAENNPCESFVNDVASDPICYLLQKIHVALDWSCDPRWLYSTRFVFDSFSSPTRYAHLCINFFKTMSARFSLFESIDTFQYRKCVMMTTSPSPPLDICLSIPRRFGP